MLKFVMRRFFLRSLLLSVLLVSVLTAAAASSVGFQALCVDCSGLNFQCDYVTYSAHASCSEFTGGCVAAGECTIKTLIHR